MDTLEQLGLTVPVLIMLIMILVLAGLVIYLMMKTSSMKRQTEDLENRCNRFMMGTGGGSLEDDISDIFRENREIADTMIRCEDRIDDLYFRIQCMIQKVGVVKYDAFSQMGGELSYAIALLDESDNGFVINSVHSAEGCYSYTKVIRRGKPDIDLGSEEAEALRRALTGYKERGQQ